MPNSKTATSPPLRLFQSPGKKGQSNVHYNTMWLVYCHKTGAVSAIPRDLANSTGDHSGLKSTHQPSSLPLPPALPRPGQTPPASPHVVLPPLPPSASGRKPPEVLAIRFLSRKVHTHPQHTHTAPRLSPQPSLMLAASPSTAL